MHLQSAHLISAHILTHLASHRAAGSSSPLFVAIQGPQGSGKTTVTRVVQEKLSSPPYSLSIVSFSLDDLYLPHAELTSLAQRHPENGLLKGRGQPGTHDVALGEHILARLLSINDPDSMEASEDLEIPSFDKSLFNGKGDRLAPGQGLAVKAPVDVVLLEGWCMGFYPLDDEELEKRYLDAKEAADGTARGGEGLPDLKEVVETYSLDDLKTVNVYLGKYVESIYRFFTVFVQLVPASEGYSLVYKWRLQQEHHMKTLNGGRGMSDLEVKS
ncbi:hypothetical protein FRB99_004028 [Tulasnella sp. 403]|nr:hypothetical protein FRB99_004028 [Tulasnella sp. 403]